MLDNEDELQIFSDLDEIRWALEEKQVLCGLLPEDCLSDESLSEMMCWEQSDLSVSNVFWARAVRFIPVTRAQRRAELEGFERLWLNHDDVPTTEYSPSIPPGPDSEVVMVRTLVVTFDLVIFHKGDDGYPPNHIELPAGFAYFDLEISRELLLDANTELSELICG
jgi:hypothetical protein